jgi:hypothetical protein
LNNHEVLQAISSLLDGIVKPIRTICSTYLYTDYDYDVRPTDGRATQEQEIGYDAESVVDALISIVWPFGHASSLHQPSQCCVEVEDTATVHLVSAPAHTADDHDSAALVLPV